MKAKALIVMAFISLFCLPVFARNNDTALKREINHIEQTADELMHLVLEIQDRRLRREVVAEVDDLYEAAERMRVLVVGDSTPEPIREEDLAEFLKVLEGSGLGDTKVDMIAEFAVSNWFTVDQVGYIVETLPFGDNKVDAILMLYPHLVDPENAYLLYEYVTFSDDRERLRQGLDALRAVEDE